MEKIIERFNKNLIYILPVCAFIMHSIFIAQYPVCFKLFKFIIFAIILIWLSIYYLSRIKNKKFFSFNFQEILIIVFSLLAVFSGFINFKNYMDLSEPVVLGSFMLFIYLYINKCNYKIDIKKILVMMIIMSLLALFYSLFIGITNYSYGTDANSYNAYLSNSFNWIGLFTNPNRFGSLMMVGFISSTSLLCLSLDVKNKKIMLVFSLISFILLSLGLLLSQSRASILGAGIFFLGTGILVIIKHWQTLIKYYKLWIIFFCLICLSVFVFWQFGLFHNILKKMDQGTSFRYGFWVAFTLDRFQNFDFSKFFIGEGYTKNVNLLSTEFNLHNGFLEIFGHFGFPALITFLTMLCYQLIQNIKKSYWFIYFITFGFIAYSIFESIIFFTSYSIETFAFLIFLFYRNNNDLK